jgi:hypothetical protein
MVGIVKSPGRKSATDKAKRALPAKSTVRNLPTKGAIRKVQPARRKVQPTRQKTTKKEGTKCLERLERNDEINDEINKDEINNDIVEKEILEKKNDEINNVIRKEIDIDEINAAIVDKETIHGLQLYISEMTRKLKQMQQLQQQKESTMQMVVINHKEARMLPIPEIARKLVEKLLYRHE